MTLKTLKDITCTDIELDDPYCSTYYNKKGGKKTKEFIFVPDELIDAEELRQEVINWIKAFNTGELWTDFSADNRKGQENVIEWIEHFFNITEDDLK